jgi:RNA polymerase sigma-70 factor (ECF subfamily)
VNVITDDWRARRRFAEVGDEEADVEVAPAQHERDKAIDLERAIARLPERARLVFVLHDVAGSTHGEIAEQLGVTPGTSKAQLSRARQLLRKALSR